jgi:hypothetical protein
MGGEGEDVNAAEREARNPKLEIRNEWFDVLVVCWVVGWVI